MIIQYPYVLIHNTIQNTCKYKKIHENTIKIHYNTCIFYSIIDFTLGVLKKKPTLLRAMPRGPQAPTRSSSSPTGGLGDPTPRAVGTCADGVKKCTNIQYYN